MKINSNFNFLSCHLLTPIKNGSFSEAISQNKKILGVVLAIICALVAVVYVVRHSWSKPVKQIPSATSSGEEILSDVDLKLSATRRATEEIHKNEMQKVKDRVAEVVQKLERESDSIDSKPNVEKTVSALPKEVELESSPSASVDTKQAGINQEILQGLAELEKVPKLDFGLVLKGETSGTPPNLIGMVSKDGIEMIETEKVLTGAFAACFHTTQSHEEILELLFKIKEAQYQKHGFFAENPPSNVFGESMFRLTNNLIGIHDALPGPHAQKKMKIYWNERVEKILIPHLLKKEMKSEDIQRLMFGMISGESALLTRFLISSCLRKSS